METLYLTLLFIGGYFIGNVNFARIFSLLFAKKDITTVGSKNPGTMNMLRTRGFKEAFLTLIFEAIKSGAPALGMFYLFAHFFPGTEHIAYVLTAVGAVLGHCYPVFYKFKGGKGVACTFGLFVFHPDFWWIALIMFAIGFVLFFFIDYPFINSFIYISIMTIYGTCFYALNYIMWYIPIIIILWLNVALIIFLHRGNIKRLLDGTENKVHFIDKFIKDKKKKTDVPRKEEKVVEEVKSVETEQETVEDVEPEVEENSDDNK